MSELTILKYRCRSCSAVTTDTVETDEDMPKSIKCKLCGRVAWLVGFGPSNSGEFWKRKRRE